MQPILTLNSPAMLDVVGWRGHGVVDREDDRKSPCEQGEDLVGDDGRRSMGVPLGEGIY